MTRTLVRWNPPDDLLAILQLHDPELRPWEHIYEGMRSEAEAHAQRASATLFVIFKMAGLDENLIKVEILDA